MIIAAASFAACSDWTEVENKNFLPSMTQKDEAYKASIRAFKESEHKKSMMMIKGSEQLPNHQNQHPMAMPDSVDFLLMEQVDNLNAAIVAEIAEVHEQMGTQTLNVVDFNAIRESWEALKNAAIDTENEADYDESKFPAYCSAETQKQLDNCTEYGFHGIVVNYMRRRSEGVTAIKPFINVISAWMSQNSDKRVFYRGYPSYVNDALAQEGGDKEFFNKCDYIIILTKDNKSNIAINREIRSQMESKTLPRDRVVLEASVPVLADGGDDAQVGATAQEAAEWVMLEDANAAKLKIVKAGLCLSNTQEDYFNTPNYKRVREAIGIMNTVAEEN